MSAFLPQDSLTFAVVGALLAGTLLLGLAITRVRSLASARVAAWLLVAGATAGAERLCRAEPAGFRMLAIIGVLLYAMKAVVSVEAAADGAPRLSPLRWLGFAALWPGMRPAPFAEVGRGQLPGAGPLVLNGVIRLAAGAVLVLFARLAWLYLSPHSRTTAIIVATVLALPGLSLVLHFGIFNVVAGLWRLAGAGVRPLFRAPLLSTSLTEFWGRRWNLAFSEMTAVAIYRPAARRLGRGPATLLAFLASGVLHELAISVPVKAGYGLPMLYFVLHGGLVLTEQAGLRPGGWLGRAWVLGWLALPLPVLFHPWFLRGVVWPLLGILG